MDERRKEGEGEGEGPRDPELERIIEAMRARNEGEWDERAAWAKLREKMDEAPVRPIRVHRTSPPLGTRIVAERAAGRRQWIGAGLAVAAALVIAVGFNVMAERRSAERAQLAQTAPSREITTKRGERATIDLADGTHVILAPGSRLVIPGEFNGPARELRLEGEAHFTVEHDSLRPFRVLTSNAVAEDIGTAFVVSAYPETNGTRVVVSEGEVALRSGASRPLMLVAGELGRAPMVGVTTKRSGVDVGAYTAWTRDTLAFDGTPLREAVPQLERWFDIDISLGDVRLAERRLTGRFAHGSVERLLHALSIALDVSVKRAGEGRAVLMTRREPAPSEDSR